MSTAEGPRAEGTDAQDRLRAAAAIVVGAGALGSPAAVCLAATGVGQIGIVDASSVEPADTAREWLHWTPDAGANRAESAAAKLGLFSGDARVEPYPVRLEVQNARAIVSGAAVVLDCSGSVETRYLVNDACCAERVPLVLAEAEYATGWLLAVRPGDSACYRCAFPTAAPSGLVGSGREARASAPVAGAVGSLQALQAVRLVSGDADACAGSLLELDAGVMSLTRSPVSRRGDCPACAGLVRQPQSP